MNMHYFVYIIKSSKDNKYYTGITNNIERRLEEHNRGKHNTPSTLNRGPFILIYKEVCSTRQLARSREKLWRSGSGRELRDKIAQ